MLCVSRRPVNGKWGTVCRSLSKSPQTHPAFGQRALERCASGFGGCLKLRSGLFLPGRDLVKRVEPVQHPIGKRRRLDLSDWGYEFRQTQFFEGFLEFRLVGYREDRGVRANRQNCHMQPASNQAVEGLQDPDQLVWRVKIAVHADMGGNIWW